MSRVAASKMLSSPLSVLSVRLDGTPPSWCKARRVCVRLCLDIRSSQLQDFLVFAMPASGSCVRHAQWREAGGEEGGGKSRDEERQREKRDLCAQRTLQGQPEHICAVGNGCSLASRHQRAPMLDACCKADQGCEMNNREHFHFQSDTESSRGAIYQAAYHFDFCLCANGSYQIIIVIPIMMRIQKLLLLNSSIVEEKQRFVARQRVLEC